MKLLFDQNISFRVVKALIGVFPEVKQVRELGLEDSSDREIWEFAKRNGYTIVTFDSDFYDLILLLGFPPKIIWLRCGNTSTDSLISFLKNNQEIIEEFIKKSDYDRLGCLELT